jgi:regulator of protease activity HflC (stomatin/prohibitin superfamily)
MFLIIIGIIVIVIGFVIAKSNSPARAQSTFIKWIGVAAIVVGIAWASVIKIEAGEVGVQKLFGKVSDRILESGLNLKNPLVVVVPFDIRTQNYTMSGIQDEVTRRNDDAIRVLSADGLEVIIDLPYYTG